MNGRLKFLAVRLQRQIKAGMTLGNDRTKLWSELVLGASEEDVIEAVAMDGLNMVRYAPSLKPVIDLIIEEIRNGEWDEVAGEATDDGSRKRQRTFDL